MQDFPGGGGVLFGGKVDLKPKGGGGVSFGENVDLCTIPYGVVGPRGGGVFGPPDPLWLYTGLNRYL